ncbi:response regulator [bacterium]|nr:response regulator [bacterium]
MAKLPQDSNPKTRIKARRQEDRRLLRHSDVLAAILNTAGTLIVVLNAEGEIITFNKACETITGFTAEEAVGRYLWDVANPPDQADQVREFYQMLIRREFPETHERYWTDRDGIRHLIKWSNAAIRDDAGTLKYIVATGHDITESRHARLELQKRSAQLTERIKELRCLFGISQLSIKPNLTLQQFIQGVAELIPPAWQYPELCSARVRIDDTDFTTPGYGDSTVCQRRPVYLGGQPIGEIQVCYASLPEPDQEPFLVEEEQLLINISEAVSLVVADFASRQRIREYQERLRSLASELALTGERERHRIAQQLHNEIGHKLASLKFRLGEQTQPPAKHVQTELIGLIESTIESTRNLTFELSPPVLHELGLGAALEWLSHQLEVNYGIPCEYADDRQPKPLNEDLRVEVFQAVRELLANVGKHAQASGARVGARVVDGQLIIEVSDNGRGFNAQQEQPANAVNLGWGLFGIRERLAHLGAKVTIDSAPGRGTTARISAPLVEESAAAVAPRGELEAPPAKPQREPIRILLADDQQLTRAGLRALLERAPDFTVVAEAVDGEQAVSLAAEHGPDVVVMDVAMPKLNGIQATSRILAQNPNIKVIGLSMHSDGQFVVEMLRAGATGYLLKDCAQDDLAQAIRVVQANLTFLSPGLAASVASKYVQNTPAPDEPASEADLAALDELTAREREVLVLLAGGQNTKQIAQQLAVSVKTVETHRQHVMEKLDDRTIAGLTRFAIRCGLVSLSE